MTEQAPSIPLVRPGAAAARLRALLPGTPPPHTVGALALVCAGLLQTWTGTNGLGDLSRPATFLGQAGRDQVWLSCAQALLGLLACSAGLVAGSGRRWGLRAGIAIAAIGCGFALAAVAVR
jgi:hypothetical protein